MRSPKVPLTYLEMAVSDQRTGLHVSAQAEMVLHCQDMFNLTSADVIYLPPGTPRDIVDGGGVW